MRHAGRLVLECFGAEAAGMFALLRVDESVAEQVRALVEASATDTTAERLLFAVDDLKSYKCIQ